jgi:2'-5' RNA ligase
MSFRAFVAVDVECRDALRKTIEGLRGYGRVLKPVSPDHVHVTLKFLGETEESAVPQLEAVMRNAVLGKEPFTVRLVGVGVFPNPRRPRVVWAGMEGAEPLGTMAAALEEGCEPLGFRLEKRQFSPHLTLARVREGFQVDLSEFLREHQHSDFGTFEVRSVRLKRSVLTPAGPIYSDVLVVDL